MAKCNAIVFKDIKKIDIEQIEIPEPSNEEVLIKTLCCGICQREINVLTGRLKRTFPTVMGHEVVGKVVKCGRKVNIVKQGDYVSCITDAGLSEFCVANMKYVRKINYKQTQPIYAYLAEPIMCVIAAVRKSSIEMDKKILVIGAGFMGNLLVQALKIHVPYGSIDVFDINQNRLQLIRDSYNIEIIKEKKNIVRNSYDIVFEASGCDDAINDCTDYIRNGGMLCLFGHHFKIPNYAVNQWHLRGISVLNTVPWASDNLERDFSNAVYALNNGLYNMKDLITNVYSYKECDKLLGCICSNDTIKSVITF